MSGGTATRSRPSRSTQSNSSSGRSETQRAEDVVENLAERATSWLSRAVARTREEAEDVWAEAKALRRGNR